MNARHSNCTEVMARAPPHQRSMLLNLAARQRLVFTIDPDRTTPSAPKTKSARTHDSRRLAGSTLLCERHRLQILSHPPTPAIDSAACPCLWIRYSTADQGSPRHKIVPTIASPPHEGGTAVRSYGAAVSVYKAQASELDLNHAAIDEQFSAVHITCVVAGEE